MRLVAVWCAFETAMKARPTIMVSTEQILAPGDRPRAGCGKGCAMRPARILRAAGARRRVRNALMQRPRGWRRRWRVWRRCGAAARTAAATTTAAQNPDRGRSRTSKNVQRTIKQVRVNATDQPSGARKSAELRALEERGGAAARRLRDGMTKSREAAAGGSRRGSPTTPQASHALMRRPADAARLILVRCHAPLPPRRARRRRDALAAAAAPARTAVHAQAPPRLPHATPYYPHDPPVHPASEPPCSIAGILPQSTPAGRVLISGRAAAAAAAATAATAVPPAPSSSPSLLRGDGGASAA